jgi:hypothetical protein
MSATVRKVTVSLIVVISLVVAVCALILPSEPVARDTPFMREYARIHVLCGKLLSGGAAGKSIDGLLAAGILSVDDATYIRDHHIQFHGFDPARIGADIAVFETICTNTTPPRRIVGYSDGSTVSYDLNKTP